MKLYYAAQSPRGFSNEINVYSFASKAERDAWVSKHENDGDCNSAYQGAYCVTRAEAKRIGGPAIGYMGFPDPTKVNATHIAA